MSFLSWLFSDTQEKQSDEGDGNVCPSCGGSGVCQQCGGAENDCPICTGTGICPECQGTGSIKN